MPKPRLLFALGFFLACLFALKSWTRLLIAQDNSLPYRAFFMVRFLKPKKGDFVAIRGHDTAYLHNLHFTKALAGLPGDEVDIQERCLFLSDRCVAPLQSKTPSGSPLTPLPKQTIPPGFALVLGEHPNSFDSRYQEFGLVPLSKIEGKVFALW